MSRSSLSFDSLSDFKPRSGAAAPSKEQLDAAAGWPSREPSPEVSPVKEGQMNIRADEATLRRFKRLCKDDRRTYGDMLRILMDAYEKGRG